MGTSSEAAAEAATPVNFATRRSFGGALGSNLKETFFPDDPFRRLKDRPAAGKAWGAVKYFVPILEWAPHYTLSNLRYDLLAGVTIASLAIPQGISYARLANLPPIIGLYSSFVPPLVYAVFGSSKNLAVGTVAAGSLLLASTIGGKVSATADPELYLQIVFTAAFFTGVFQLAIGIFRLGILVDFLSRSTITGFMGGTACIIILQQLKGFFGLNHFTTHTDLVSVMHSIFTQTHQWRWQSAVLGICLLCFLLFTRHLKMKVPRLFWVSAISPLLVVVLGCLFAYVVHAEDHGIPTVGNLKKGLNPISILKLKFESPYIGIALKAGVVSGFLALAEGISVGRSLALLKNEQIDGNKEMIAFGMMNIAGSFTSCYLTTGPFSKSAVNYHAGCRTAVSNIVMSICMMMVLLFLAPIFKYTPLVALSAIIVVAMIGLIEYEEIYHLFKVDKFDFVICIAAFLGVLLVSMVTGLLLSIGLSVVRALLYVARPTTCKLGIVGGSDIYRDMEHYPDTTSPPQILIIQLGSPIYFANSGYLRERISRWVEDEENIKRKNGEALEFVILEMGGVTCIDNTGIGMLFEVYNYLDRRGMKLALTNPRLEVVEKLVLSNYVELIGREWVFLSIKDAVTACGFAMQESRHPV